ncbi:MAG: T9SS type A sorting domain-containing protein [Bacteroidetes bacterium]|nr:MAG: T9SS type A sorting domain-containing protein [Bacteroidota bacterium]
MRNLNLLLIILLIIFIQSFALSQTTTRNYLYDEMGNRTTRVVLLNQPPPPPGGEYRDSIKNSEISIYPNPTQGLLTVKITNLKKDVETKIVINDMSGRAVFTFNNLSEFTDINFSEKTNGVYLMKIYIGSDVSDWKILKEK